MTRILAIEAATDACSVALLIDGDVRERFEVAPRRHAALALPFAESLLQEAGLALATLDAIAFGRGPGSFTGLRIAAGMAQGMAFGAELPVIPVSTLAALALGAARERQVKGVLAALDARMKEVYWGAWRCQPDGSMELVGDEGVYAPADVPRPEAGDWLGAGSGWDSYAGVLAERCGLAPSAIELDVKPHAADVARIAGDLLYRGYVFAPEQALPVYLRDNVADKPKAGA